MFLLGSLNLFDLKHFQIIVRFILIQVVNLLEKLFIGFCPVSSQRTFQRFIPDQKLCDFRIIFDTECSPCLLQFFQLFITLLRNINRPFFLRNLCRLSGVRKFLNN